MLLMNVYYIGSSDVSNDPPNCPEFNCGCGCGCGCGCEKGLVFVWWFWIENCLALVTLVAIAIPTFKCCARRYRDNKQVMFLLGMEIQLADGLNMAVANDHIA
jgi:hypothetical protein